MHLATAAPATHFCASLLELLLHAELRAVATLALAAVSRTGGQARVAPAADLLFAVVLRRKHLERGLDDTTAQAEDKVQRALLLDVVVAEGPAVLKLLAGKDEALLVRRNALLVLDLGLDDIDRVVRLDLERDRLASEGLDEDLHGDDVGAKIAAWKVLRTPCASRDSYSFATHVITKIIVERPCARSLDL